MTVVAQGVTVVAQWAKAPGIHCYVAGSIPAVTPRYCRKKIEKMLCRAQKKRRKKKKKVEIFEVAKMSMESRKPIRTVQYRGLKSN